MTTTGTGMKQAPIEFITNGADLSGTTLITGFYGIGKIGFISVNHLIQKLGAEKIGFVLSEYLPPFISVKSDNLVLPFEIYKKNNLVFLVTFFEPYKYEHRNFAKAVVDWMKSNHMESLILIGGLDSRLRTDPEIIAKAVYTSSYKSNYPTNNIPVLDEGLYVTGPLALIMMYCEIFDLPAMGVLPYAERSRPDPIGASHAVEVVNDLLNLECGVQELVAEAENIEKEIQSMMDVSENAEDDEQVPADKGMFL